MKFKGAVLQNREALSDIKNMLSHQNGPCVVVVSALKGIMPRLRQLYALSVHQGCGFEEEFQEFHLIRKKQMIPGRDPGDGFYIAVFEKES